MNKFFSRLRLVAASLATVFALQASASAETVSCQLERARATTDRVDARCQGVNRWFIAMRSATDAQSLDQMLELMNAAILTGKSVNLYYNLDSAGNGILWGVEIFK